MDFESHEILEGSTPEYEAFLKNEQGVPVADSVLSAARLTLFNVSSGRIINQRYRQSILNTNQVTIDNFGQLNWKLLEADTTLIGNPKPEVGQYRAVFVFEWSDAQLVARQAIWVVDLFISRVTLAPFHP